MSCTAASKGHPKDSQSLEARGSAHTKQGKPTSNIKVTLLSQLFRITTTSVKAWL
jgi:hypothetical protein